MAGQRNPNRVGQLAAVASLYAVMGTLLPLLKVRFISATAGIVISVILFMMLQLLLVVCLARVQMGWRACIALLVPMAVAAVGLTFVLVTSRITLPWLLSLVMSGRSLAMMLAAGALGYLVSHIIQEANLLLPAAVFAALVDYWSVTWGPLGHMLEKKASVVAAASVQMLALGQIRPVTMIGIGDFVFLALFFGVLYRFNMNVKGAFWAGYALLTASMICLVYSANKPAIPALVPMSLAVLGANYKYFKLKREELLAMLYVGLFLLVCIVIAGFYFLHL